MKLAVEGDSFQLASVSCVDGAVAAVTPRPRPRPAPTPFHEPVGLPMRADRAQTGGRASREVGVAWRGGGDFCRLSDWHWG